MTHVWLSNPETGGTWRAPVESADVWRARGWVDCDPPAEPDLTDTYAVDGVPRPPEDPPEQPAKTSRKRAARSGEEE